MRLEKVSWNRIEEPFIQSWGRTGNRWEAQHVAILGPTGSGKSYLATHIVKERAERRNAHAVMVITKPGDSTITKVKWPIIREWPPKYYGEERVVFWPKVPTMKEGLKSQRDAIADMLDDLWRPNANTIVYFDEIAYVEIDLGLRQQISRAWREARSLGITLVATTQRPRNVSRYMHSEPTWKFSFRFADEDDARRAAEILGNRREFLDPLLRLKAHEFILWEKGNSNSYVSRLTR